jgi:hypothetical protein
MIHGGMCTLISVKISTTNIQRSLSLSPSAPSDAGKTLSLGNQHDDLKLLMNMI